jgi:hypothetical protein
MMGFFVNTNDINMPLIILASIGQSAARLYMAGLLCLVLHYSNIFPPHYMQPVHLLISVKNYLFCPVGFVPSDGIYFRILHPIGSVPLLLIFCHVRASVF